MPAEMRSFRLQILRENKWTWIGGLAATLLALGGMLGVGGVGRWEALDLLDSILPTVRFLCSGVMTATATILALMLTLLALSFQVGENIEQIHYERIRFIAVLDTAAFAGSTILLLWLAIPLKQSETIPEGWFSWIYYLVVVSSALLGGLLVIIVLMLYETIHHMIRHAETGSHLAAEEEVESE